MTDEDRAFHLHMEEYRTLRAEIAELQKLRATTAQLGLAGMAAIWAFLVALDLCAIIPTLAKIGWFVPVAVALGGLILTRHATQNIRHGGAYLGLIEEEYAKDFPGGWHNRFMRMKEPSLDEKIPGDEDRKALLTMLRERTDGPRVSLTLEYIWGGLLAISIIVAAGATSLIDEARLECADTGASTMAAPE